MTARHGIQPNLAPSGLSPSDLKSAYALPSSGGSGQTVAIVDAYDDPNAESDLATYRSQYGLPACTHTDSATQSVTIPSGCKASLNLWLHIDTSETGGIAYDKLTIKIGTTTLATYTNVNAASGYVNKTFDVSSFAGQTVTLSFTGTEDSSPQTSFVLDDIAINAS